MANSISTIVMKSPNGIEEECIYLNIEDMNDPFVLHNVTTSDQEYTFSCWLWCETSGYAFVVDVDHTQIKYDTPSGYWRKCEFTFVASKSDIKFNFAGPHSAYIYHPQLELGNKATDWVAAPEDTDDVIVDASTAIRADMIEQSTSIRSYSDSIVSEAFGKCVKSDEYGEYQESVSSRFTQTDNTIEANFTTTNERLDGVNDDLHSFRTEFSKYIRFTSETAMVIGSGDSAITLEIDNETGIIFKKNGVQFGWWDGVDFHTGNVVIELHERAQIGNFAFVPRSDGSLSFLKVGG